MRIVFAGTPEVAVPSLHALVRAGHEVVGAVTREDAPLGRKRVLTPSPVATAAAELGIPTLKANRLDAAATEWVRGLAPELGVVVAYGGLVREPLLSAPVLGWINLHFSELPRWRGAAPVQRALQAGEQRLGVTVFRLVAALDAGDVLSRDAREFPHGTSAGEALAALADSGTSALLAAVEALAADPAAGEPQDGEASYAHKLAREDGRIDLARSADEVLAHWAGVTPEPGAYVLHDGAPLKLHVLAAAPDSTPDAEGPAGAPVEGVADPAGTATLEHGAAILRLGGADGTARTALELVRVQPAGKPAMDGAAWLRGRGGKAVLA
ncbi:methionyl-tRNA formyltransferase [Leucobacter allii]|uniref:methionyl-tRNA formyltransferase n=1 Tax=Leucobacter allii TaxID=2932247 RepID=UPI001FCF8657|nr:methionyl-tRNA formyltransferase [Leucobacter allii]UOR02956.1 methionyl-tRNA formyltransferase [Leucobacter allii]